MTFASPYKSFGEYENPPVAYRLTEGSELIFTYDMGSPTTLAVTVERIQSMPAGDRKSEDYPLVKCDYDEAAAGEKRKRIAETPVLTITMDAAYPQVSARMKEFRTSLEIGRGSDGNPCCKVGEGCWARVWDGDENSAYDRSVECPVAFADADEAWLCVERGIARQIAEDGPALTRTLERRSLATGEIYREQKDDSSDDTRMTVVLQAYPHCVDPTSYQPEMETDMRAHQELTKRGAVPKDPILRSWSRYAFNYTLPANWKNEPENTAFSFAQQFPKCALWLTYTAKSCQWLSLERGVLCAVKSKNKACGGVNNVLHKTAQARLPARGVCGYGGGDGVLQSRNMLQHGGSKK